MEGLIKYSYDFDMIRIFSLAIRRQKVGVALTRGVSCVQKKSESEAE